MSKDRILVVDDEPKYVLMITTALRALDYEVVEAHNGREAVEAVAIRQPVLVLMDVRMPEMDGLEACQRIRSFSSVPILMLTALAEPTDVVDGLEAGADDYITKPFKVEVMLARVRSALRRASLNQGPPDEPVFEVGLVRVDYGRREVTLAGVKVHITPIEYQVLTALTRHAGQVVPSSSIVEQVWGRDHAGEDEMVRRVIHRLRGKLEADPATPRYLLTQTGFGYMFNRRA